MVAGAEEAIRRRSSKQPSGGDEGPDSATVADQLDPRYWIEKWAFATSQPPFGLGLSSAEFWFLSHEEFTAKVRCFERHSETQFVMLATLRADLHNGQMEKRDKSMFTPQDFGAPGEVQKNPRRKFTPDEILPKIRAGFGGKLKDKDGKKISAVKSLKGQPMPERKRG